MGVLNTVTDPDSLLPGIGVNSGLEYGSERTMRLWAMRWYASDLRPGLEKLSPGVILLIKCRPCCSDNGPGLGGHIGFTNRSDGRGVSGGFAYGSVLADVGEPKDSWAGEGRLLSCMSDTEPLRGVLEPDGGGLGVPTILPYGSHGEGGRDPDDSGENI